MDDMSYAPQHEKAGKWRDRAIAFFVLCMVAGLVVYGVAGSYESLSHWAAANGAPLPRWMPLSFDGALLGAIVFDIWLTWKRRSVSWWRQVARLFGVAAVIGNGWAAWPDAAGVFMRVFAPLLVVLYAEVTRTVMLRHSDDPHDPVPLSRWLLAFPSTFRMWRRMKLWRIRSYTAAIEMELCRLQAIEKLREKFGEGWRGKVGGTLTWMLDAGVKMDDALAMVAKLTAAPQSPSPATVTRRKGATVTRRRQPATPVPVAPEIADLDSESAALAILAVEPGISGSRLGERIGKSRSYGRELKQRLTGAEHETGPLPRVGS